jgi:hypothetical protein
MFNDNRFLLAQRCGQPQSVVIAVDPEYAKQLAAKTWLEALNDQGTLQGVNWVNALQDFKAEQVKLALKLDEIKTATAVLEEAKAAVKVEPKKESWWKRLWKKAD